MKVILPFWDLRKWPRYKRQFEELASFSELHLVYSVGEAPESPVIFHKVRYSRNIPRLISESNRGVRIKPDLVYSLSGTSLQASGLNMATCLGLPLLIRVRGDGRTERAQVWAKKGMRRTWALRALYNILDRETLAQADHLIPISRKTRDRLLQWGLEERRILEPIPNGVDTDLFRESPLPGEMIVGYAGRINEHKGSRFMVELMKKTPGIKYLVAGPIDEPVKWPSNCEYLGHLDFNDMPEFLARVQVLILPSRSEGQPRVVMEAYSCGRPVLVNVACYPMEIPLHGQLAPLRVEAWVRILKALEPEDWEELATGARETALRYSWRNYQEKMKAVFMASAGLNCI